MNSNETQEKPKANKLGNFALIFAFLFPVLGLILGIFALVVGSKKEDGFLRKDGVKAIVISVAVVIVILLILYLLVALGGAVPFIIFS